MPDFAAPRDASTVLLLRDAQAGGEIEIFMMVRHIQVEFQSGALVFPGGSVDTNDREIAKDASLFAGGERLDADALAFRIAAVRETFEESGILLARPKGAVHLIDAARAREIEKANRVALNGGTITFRQILTDNDLVLSLDALVPYAHWITPEVAPKRFDTWFFLAAAPPDQLGAHDGHETTDSVWLSPREALAGGESGRFKLPFPTTRNLIRLGKLQTVQDAFADGRSREIVTVMPVVTKIAGGRQLRIPKEAGYDGELFDVGAAG